MLEVSDALYIVSEPSLHYEQIKDALMAGKHILCESPIALTIEQSEELHEIAQRKHCVLMDAIKTAYATAYARMLLLVKSGKIGDIVSVDATATSLRDIEIINNKNIKTTWNKKKNIVSKLMNEDFDLFTHIEFVYEHAIATVKVGKGVKSEGELIITGTKGYVYIPAPWWKTEYFEIRYENQNNNKRYFFHLDEECIRYELLTF